MKGIFGKPPLGQLSVVVTIDKQSDILDQGMQPSGEATRSSCEAFEVMAQICVDRFHGVGLLLVWA